MPISPRNSQSLSSQIETDLRARIAKGEFVAGQRFPSLRKLASEYGVAELTVHAAIRGLQRAGVLVSMSGRGTFVSDGSDSDSAGSTEDTSVLAELLAMRAELQELRERFAAQEAATNVHERLQELTDRVAALERPIEPLDQ